MIENNITDIRDRIKYLRENVLDIKQNEMSLRLGLKQGSLSDIERKKTKTVTDRVINDICREFSVNEKWLRYGEGEILIQPETFSLDEYAKKRNLTALELDIIKGYLELDSDLRQNLLLHFKSIFDKHSEIAATKEDYINREVENYRRELEAEQKGEILSVLHAPKENIG